MRTPWLAVLIATLAIFPAPAADVILRVGYATADLKAAKEAGFDFAEVRIREFMKLSDAEFAKFAADCHSNGLPLTTGYWFLPNDLKVVGPDVDLPAVTNYFGRALERCETLGVKIIVWGSGDARRCPEGFPKAKAFGQLVALGKILAPMAGKRGIIVVAEPLRRTESNTINSVAEGLEWVKAVNHPSFQLLVDLYHMTEEHEDASEIVTAGEHIHHVHISNPIGRVFPLSAGEFDYAPFFGALKEIGYRGTITIEARTDHLAIEGPRSIQFIRARMSSIRPSRAP